MWSLPAQHWLLCGIQFSDTIPKRKYKKSWYPYLENEVLPILKYEQPSPGEL
jgi:hypothetical protein